VGSDYTLRFNGRLYQIARADIRAGLRGATIRVEARLDGSVAVRFQDHYLAIAEREPQPKIEPPPKPVPVSRRRPKPPPPSEAMRQAMHGIAARGGRPVWLAAKSDRVGAAPDDLD